MILLWSSAVAGVLSLLYLLFVGSVRTVRAWHRGTLRSEPLRWTTVVVVLMVLAPLLYLTQPFLAIGDPTPANLVVATLTGALPIALLLSLLQRARERVKVGEKARAAVLDLVVLGAALQWCVVLAVGVSFPWRSGADERGARIADREPYSRLLSPSARQAMSTSPASSGVPAWVRPVAIVAALGGGLWLVNHVLDRLLYPWAYGSGGRPVLMGTWVGGLTTGGGRPRAVLMEIVREEPSPGTRRPCRGCTDGIEGTAVTCDERGRVWRYQLGGKPENRKASKLHAGTSPVAVPRPDGLSMSAVRGGWDGADALDLEAEFSWHQGTSSISSTGDPDTRGWVPLPMRRSTEDDFRARCRTILGPAIPEVVP